MRIVWLSETDINFPDPKWANRDGIVAVGGDLSPDRLMAAYTKGLFPWFNPDDPILWWSPDPRFVLFPDELIVHKSMRSYFNQNKYSVTYDQEFLQIITNCQEKKRKDQPGGTWITDDMIKGYHELHNMGYAHSVEVWDKDELVGGLYGVSLGKCFFGESMFTFKPNASKFGFISLVKKLIERDFWLIDCQQKTQHLGSLGARPISRESFLETMARNEQEESLIGNWGKLFAS